MKIKYEILRKYCYIYILLPVFCFLLFYMQSIVGFAAALFLGISCFFLWKDIKGGSSQPGEFSWKIIFLLWIVAVIWSFFGGQGYLYYQSGDWGCRNAIFRDLIYREWPVVYEQYDKALVYYIGFWLPVASIVKVIGMIVPVIYETECAFMVANIILWFWTSIGILLVELLLVSYVKVENRKRLFLIPTILILFSGMDIIGVFREIFEKGRTFQDLHIEWWSLIYELQYSSITTCLFWVFNQAVIPWIVIMMLLQEKNEKYYILMGIGALTSGPIPFLGIAVYMVMMALTRGITYILGKDLKRYIGYIFSLSNIFAIVVIPVILSYYRCNRSVQTGQSTDVMCTISFFSIKSLTTEFIKEVVVFVLLEAGIYLLLLYKSNKENICYYITVASLLIAPFITIGIGGDFTMRFSIPAIMVLAAMCMKELVNNVYQKNDKKNKGRIIALWCVFVIGAVTPMTEFMRGYHAVLMNGKINNVYDNVVTFNQECVDYNFMSYDYEDTFFYQYLVRKK